ncbi:MAG TPA: hypothetical protein VL426_02765 [Candidatus Binatia bacterium]|jgi:hypothetical protein|nr:hypothetical protein [Candidatus Binatia bacterium]
MRVSEGDDKKEVSNRRQHDLAEGCDTTVVTEAAPFIYHGGGDVLRDAADQVFNQRPARYDLLSYPSLKHLTKEQRWIDILAHDVATAIGLHGVEKLLVAAHTVPPRNVILRLKENPAVPARLRVKGFTLQRPRVMPDPKVMALTCMDWRLHGAAGFGSQFANAFEASGYSVMATAGAAKELAHESPRSEMLFSQFELVAGKVGTLVLVSHTDCGKYGGARAFASPEAELRTLTDDLEAARSRILAAFPKLKVRIGIARTKGTRCNGVDPVGA